MQSKTSTIATLITNFENAKGNIDRKSVMEVSKKLNIYHKQDASVLFDEHMVQRAGNNPKPRVIEVYKTFDKYGNLNDLRKEVIDYAKNNLVGKKIIIKDTNSTIEITNAGIKKTFSGRTVEEKLQTINKLEDIISEGIYFNTSYNIDDNTGIKFHHFLTPVKSYNKVGNTFIRIVIKEYTRDKNINDKFYYHQFEYIDNK